MFLPEQNVSLLLWLYLQKNTKKVSQVQHIFFKGKKKSSKEKTEKMKTTILSSSNAILPDGNYS